MSEPTLEELTSMWRERTNDHLDDFKSMLLKHTAEEMEKYNEIIERLDQTETNLDKLTRSQTAMNQSIHAFMTGQEAFISAICRAFPKDEDNKPDYDGHRKAHLEWITDADDEREVMSYVRKKMKEDEKSDELLNYTKKVIFAGAAFAVVSFIAIASWAAFLKGPAG